MISHNHLQQAIAISRAKGIHASTLLEVLGTLGDLDHFFSLTQAELSGLMGIKSEIFSDSYRKVLLQDAEKEAEFVRKNHIDAFFLGDDNYPRRLYNCEDAPVMLYKLGSCDLDKAHTIGIVGTRHATAYGIGFTTHLVEELSNKVDDLVVISGLAYGIDVAAHKAALAKDVPTIGVLAHGLNTIYPADHRSIAARMTSSGGALITEYTTGDTIHRSNFLARNRIVAGLCDCVVVVESDYRGGSMSTARIAMQYNREVFALPGRINDKYSRGTNKLISCNTATLLTCADELIEQMGWEKVSADTDDAPRLFRVLSADEREILKFVSENPEANINDLCVRLCKSYALVSDIIFKLEMEDIISLLPGGRMAINTDVLS